MTFMLGSVDLIGPRWEGIYKLHIQKLVYIADPA